MNKQQGGFTLIELIAVIVILGVLAATAVPRFVDLSEAAEEAAIKGVAGGFASGSSLNIAAQTAKDAGLAGTFSPVSTAGGCTVDVANSLIDGTIANLVGTDDSDTAGEYVIEGGSSFTSGVVECTLTLDASSTTETFTLHEAAG